jgi:hypothetical protein
MKSDLYSTPYIKINSIWVKDWNIIPNTANILRGNRTKVYDIGLDMISWKWPQRQGNKRKKQTFWTLWKKFKHSAKDYDYSKKANHRMGETIFKSYIW